MLVKELKGPPLDYWVAKVLGHRAIISPVDGLCKIGCRLDLVPCQSDLGQVFQPSSNWNQGGPIIDDQKIELQPGCENWTAVFDTGMHSLSLRRFCQVGPHPLIAAMRALVASKYGDKVS